MYTWSQHSADQGGWGHSVYMVTALGISRWVGSQCIHGHSAQHIKVGGVAEYKRSSKCKVQILGQCPTTRMSSMFPDLPSVMLLIIHTKNRGLSHHQECNETLVSIPDVPSICFSKLRGVCWSLSLCE